MSKHTLARYGKRTAARIRSIRIRAAAWQRQARRAVTLAVISAGAAAAGPLAHAQVGQTAMAPATGVVNRAVAGLQELNQNGPGWLYYGINAADRGLGYNGSYMTLGGFIPYSEDDLGGFWAADLRGHLSQYGGFFSNVGFVRKQFLGGSLLGVGVYWDYDGDLNQYPAYGTCGTPFGQFGHSYNQVGISTEWLTDFGNLRSNGYIPVGTTAYTAGAPNSPFYQNFVMCQYGLDTALTGADLEVGAYVPGLTDWAGMISVGGYALGNSRYNWSNGPSLGQDVVPWFGGVYTRLDMTFLENWDFSLQYNNDSYFDSTGFARLTYRMGGSRRRNVPDQMEQPMMRNEHIVRSHQTPIVALNPSNGYKPWRVVHVNNAVAPGGNGSAEAPFTTITAGNAAAANPWDIVLVAPGLSSTSSTGAPVNAYAGTFSPLAANQYFVGSGSPFFIPSACCGPINIGGLGGLQPVLSNPLGASIDLGKGLVTSNFAIVNSAVGISGTGNLSSAERGSLANNISITGTGTGPYQGIALTNTTGGAGFRKVDIAGMTDGSVVVNGGAPVVDYADGTIVNTQDHILQVNGTVGGSVSLVANPTTPFQETGDGVLVRNAAGDVTISNKNPGATAITIASQKDGINVNNSSGTQTFDGVVITAAGQPNSGYAGVNLQNNAGTSNLNNLDITLTNASNKSPGFLAVNDNVINVTGNNSINVAQAPAVSLTNVTDANMTFSAVKSTSSPTNGVLIDNVGGRIAVTSSLTVTDSAGDGLVVRNSPNLDFSSLATNVTTVGPGIADGIVLQDNSVDATKAVLGQVQVTTANGTGLVVQNAGATTTGGNITATGGASIAANTADLAVVVASATSTNSTGPGLSMVQSSGTVQSQATTVTTPAGNGINLVDNQPGFAADFGVTKVTGIANGAVGVNITNTTEPVPPTLYSFDTLSITTTNGTGLLTRNGGVVNLNSPATIVAAGGAAIDLDNTLGTTGGVAGSGFTFLDLSSTGSTGSGVRLNNLNSNLTVTGTTTIDDAAGPSLSITDNLTPPATDSITFGTVNITNRNNTGMVVDGVYGQVLVQALNVNNPNTVAGDAVTITNTTNPADPTGTGSGRVYLNGGTIDAANGNAVNVQNALASITGMSITNFVANGILASAGSGQITTVQVANSTITSAVGVDGLQQQATGGGVVNATVSNNAISATNATSNALQSIVLDGTSTISLNATGNFGPGGGGPVGAFFLNNVGTGTLSIDQASTANLSTVNNGVLVPTVPPITVNSTTPTVPPPQ
jgi:hypothetical protein